MLWMCKDWRCCVCVSIRCLCPTSTRLHTPPTHSGLQWSAVLSLWLWHFCSKRQVVLVRTGRWRLGEVGMSWNSQPPKSKAEEHLQTFFKSCLFYILQSTSFFCNKRVLPTFRTLSLHVIEVTVKQWHHVNIVLSDVYYHYLLWALDRLFSEYLSVKLSHTKGKASTSVVTIWIF